MRPPRPALAHPLPLAEIAAAAGCPSGDPTPGSWTQVLVTGVSLDSRAVCPGDLYAALPGARAHGADFAATAVQAGAKAVLTDPQGAARIAAAGLAIGGADGIPLLVVPEPRAVLGDVAALVYGHPASALHLVGITGTNGKTTTAYLVESGLRGLGATTGLIGTVETRIGAERLASVRTTPEATDLHAILALMRERGTTAVVMEVSSHALAQHRVDGVVYDVALFTNLSQDHLDFHADMDDYFAAKASLFTPERARCGVVCVDDEWGARLAAGSGIDVVTLASTDVPADWHVSSAGWPELLLQGPDARLRLTCHLPGTFNVVNTAMAALALLRLGYAAADVEAAMAVEPVVPGRMELVPGGPEDPRCIVDYAHTPEAVEAAVTALRPTTPGRLVVVLGAGGDRDRGKRRGMGAAAARWADELIVTDDNPRSEDPEAIRAEVLAGAQAVVAAGASAQVRAGSGRAEQIALAVARARSVPGSTVAVLGKGHETGQDIGGIVHPFDDRDALRAALAGVPYDPEVPA